MIENVAILAKGAPGCCPSHPPTPEGAAISPLAGGRLADSVERVAHARGCAGEEADKDRPLPDLPVRCASGAPWVVGGRV